MRTIKKRMKKMLAMLLATVLTAGLTVLPVAAATITLEYDASDQYFNVYRIFDIDATNNYTINSAFADFDYSSVYGGLGATSLWDYLDKYVKSNTPEMEALIVALEDYITNSSSIYATNAYAGTPIAENIAGDNTLTTFINNGTGEDDGYYLILAYESGTDNFLSAGSWLVNAIGLTQINPKIDLPSLDKTVGEDDEVWTTATIGQKVPFTITVNVPDLSAFFDDGTYDNSDYVFTVYDTLSEGLTFDPDSVKVTLTPLATETPGEVTTSNYAVNTSPAGGETFAIEFAASYMLAGTGSPTLKDGDILTITYEATLNENAVINEATPHNMNSAYLEYSNNPKVEDSTGETVPSNTVVYTYEFFIFKYENETAPNTPLAGATFNMVLDLETTPIDFIEVDSAGDAASGTGIYRPALESETGSPNIVSPADGMIRIFGLEAGAYTLTEILAPAGYVTLSAPLGVTIEPGADPDFGDPVITLTTTMTSGVNGNATVQQLTDDTINVQNGTGNLFPETGGIGRTIMYVVGLVIMGGAALLLIARKKMNGEEPTA